MLGEFEMSILVRDWLRFLGLFDQTTHEQRVEIDKEIEHKTGQNCDEALRRNMISKDEFKEIVLALLKRKQKEKEMVMVV